MTLWKSWFLGSRLLGRLKRAAHSICFLSPSVCTCTHPATFLSKKRYSYTVTPENTCYSTHKQLVLKALLGLTGDAFPRSPTGTTRTNFWPCHGKMVKPRKGVCHDPASDFPHVVKRVTKARIYRTDLMWDWSWPHQGTVKAGTKSLRLLLAPLGLFRAQGFWCLHTSTP